MNLSSSWLEQWQSGVRMSRKALTVSLVLQDRYVLFTVELLLVGFVVVSLWKEARAGRRGLGLEVKRGDASMAFLYIVYGIATVIYTLLVQIAESAQGHKVVLIVLDYGLLTYLCFFNSWFRNKLIELYIHIQKD